MTASVDGFRWRYIYGVAHDRPDEQVIGDVKGCMELRRRSLNQGNDDKLAHQTTLSSLIGSEDPEPESVTALNRPLVAPMTGRKA
jgi:hypothetical protein